MDVSVWRGWSVRVCVCLSGVHECVSVWVSVWVWRGRECVMCVLVWVSVIVCMV